MPPPPPPRRTSSRSQGGLVADPARHSQLRPSRRTFYQKPASSTPETLAGIRHRHEMRGLGCTDPFYHAAAGRAGHRIRRRRGTGSFGLGLPAPELPRGRGVPARCGRLAAKDRGRPPGERSRAAQGCRGGAGGTHCTLQPGRGAHLVSGPLAKAPPPQAAAGADRIHPAGGRRARSRGRVEPGDGLALVCAAHRGRTGFLRQV